MSYLIPASFFIWSANENSCSGCLRLGIIPERFDFLFTDSLSDFGPSCFDVPTVVLSAS